MPLVEEIGGLLEPYLEDGKYFVISLTVKPVRSTYQVVLLLDSDEGITIEECASISRRLAHDMESKALFENAYNIEVSSPGLDQPLVLPRQFAKNVGRNIKVHLTDGQTLTARLTGLTEQEIALELPKPKKKPKKGEEEPELTKIIPFSALSKAYIEISFK